MAKTADTAAMTAREFRTAIRALEPEIGPKAEIFAGVSCGGGGPPLDATIYLYGISNSDRLSVDGCEDWGSLLTAIKTRWAAFEAEHHRRTVRKMALAIIRITDESGVCTDAALRADDFSTADIRRFGADACSTADRIASKGPFSILAGAKANVA